MADHTRVTVSTLPISCGVMGLSRIDDDIEGVLYALGNRLYHPSRGEPVAFFVFSDVVGEPTSSSKLVTAVARKDIGRVVQSFIEENPKTGNMIAVWTWNINHVTFKNWYADERVERMRSVGA